MVFNLEEGELPEELLLSVRGRLGHSGTPEVLGAGTLNLREASGFVGGGRRGWHYAWQLL